MGGVVRTEVVATVGNAPCNIAKAHTVSENAIVNGDPPVAGIGRRSAGAVVAAIGDGAVLRKGAMGRTDTAIGIEDAAAQAEAVRGVLAQTHDVPEERAVYQLQKPFI